MLVYRGRPSIIQVLFSFMKFLMSGVLPFLFLMNSAISRRTSLFALRKILWSLIWTFSVDVLTESMELELSVMVRETALPDILARRSLKESSQ